MSKRLLIYPPHQQVGKFFRIAVLLLAMVVVTLILMNPQVKPVPALIGLFLLGSLGMYIGYIIDQQRLSFSLSAMHIQHHTPKGGWSVKWRNINQIGIPSVSQEGWHHSLPWFGIKLEDYEPFLEGISYRLAGHIIMEQRGLLLSAYRRAEEPVSNKLEDMMFDDTPYVSSRGKVYKGLIAMLANRMKYTRELLGYDIFVSADLLDRPLEDFVGLTRQYLASAGSEPAAG
ncbi:DUF2982 domain-containing protein [Grimontia hollisae]|uniref:Protein of uncharacterized function (DUF2982) n=1 Tax=Grimontia hollisae TaxID=673 RepID=A0A377HNA3_GRIHO|nr:DUF2982 domain-containing protein [Grimontia hollisae]AMG31736.1 DUF2982 domain-containing protein [Grimontia hollisae]MDF2186113.1 DUF2982 domain-containing protein [Grimontia hollisae]STO44906.1 Protein of uncharacterised function (DUF2982) [Grimontia hollisae]STO57659.1 Protein of uncharacterised function (DUF2982) [Grimontia hollisae]STQ75438.1 Protein of uncharacterised function (DUF2982) [Grimontia hollisae]